MRPIKELMSLIKQPNLLVRELFYPYLQISINQYKLLESFCGKDNIIVEIGSYKGGTTMRLAKKNHVIAIDPFLGYYDKDDEVSDEIGENRRNVINTFDRNVKGKNVNFINDTSANVLAYWKSYWPSKIHGVFIDGDHTYYGVKKDSEWIQHVKDGGFIAFHDVCDKYPGVKRFVNEEMIGKYKLIGRRGSLWIFEKSAKKQQNGN